MKFLDLFAGIGGFRLGMESAGHECVGFCEVDKFARKSYKAIHNTEGERKYHDITAVSDEAWRELRGTVDVICGGFPCQAFSIAGKRKGFLDETRGTLFFEIARAAEQIKPRTLFLENVKGLLSHDKGRTFIIILSTLDELGYNVEWQLLNSKNFGVPQNRERVFIIGHLRGTSGREVFPITGENTGAFKRVVNGRETHGHSTYDVFGTDGISPTLKTMQGGNLQPKIVVNINPSGNGMNGNVYDSERLAPTLTTNKGEGLKVAVKVKEATKKGYAIAEQGDSINFSVPNSKTRRGRVGKGIAQTLDTQCNQAVIVQKPRGFNKGGEHEIAPTLSANSWHENNLLKTGGVYTNDSKSYNSGILPGLSRTLKAHNHDAGIFDGIRVRRLTPRECWRLQGFPDWAFDKAQEVNSNSQLYKQAGNSVTVNVISEIARRLK
ncbi:DNA (cytosine-5-)-methyltransferase [Lactococcus garvieae]|uniref:DNA (cytosine-5-)-methyltransferase n=1 Tax=Lactococcus garvieae TaxID=1363 RepID=UPI0028910EBF|nr:DNA (cytosine-5-)-methyltransferase [Lactococcus garvieae]MDT2742905.1 DNA (cytosine-5-)-methyltransferase [Lactococcus garvieae]